MNNRIFRFNSKEITSKNRFIVSIQTIDVKENTLIGFYVLNAT